jgi:6-phosphofructokinase 2
MWVTKDGHRQLPAPTVKRLSTVGAGDSMVAGMVWSMQQGRSLDECVAMGVACGTAATMNPGTQLFRREDAMRLYQWVIRQKK